MDWVIVAGALSLGVLIGVLVGWYFSEAKSTTPFVLGFSISALVCSSVLAMFSFLAGLRGPTHEYWFYPVGLLIGFVIAIATDLMFYNYYGERRRPKGAKPPSS
jgi:pilus assembly protein TadC